jgi:hypothetical protein
MTLAKSKVKGKKVVETCCGPAIGDYKPSLYVDLEGKDVSQVKGLTVGQKVQMLVEGTVRSLEQRERSDEDGKMKKTGSISIESYSVDVLGDEDNEFKKLSEDDED